MKMTQIFRMLREFESTANPNTFKTLFGEKCAPHLWNQFSQKCDYNLVCFTRILDTDHQEKLMEYFEGPIKNGLELAGNYAKTKKP